MPDLFLLKDELLRFLAEKGARLSGVGNPEGITDGALKTGICVAVPVPPHIVRDLVTAPTKEYYDAYFAMNAALDAIVSYGATWLQERGYRAIANTTDRVYKDENWCTPIPHKTPATRAGLGWIGKSCLLVTEQYGSAVRLSGLLTDAPLPFDAPVNKSRCGSCIVCVSRCPGHALRGALWEVDVSREQLLDKEACKQTQLRRMKEATGIETDLCGLRFAVCPYTQRYLKHTLPHGQ